MYSVRLNYAFRTGALTGIAGNRPINLRAWTTPSHVDAWEHQGEFLSGSWIFTDYTFVPPGGSSARGRVLSLSMPSGRPSVSRPGAITCDAPELERAFFVDDGAGGCFIHGWPPCRSARCIVLPHGIEEMMSAHDGHGTLTIIS